MKEIAMNYKNKTRKLSPNAGNHKNGVGKVGKIAFLGILIHLTLSGKCIFAEGNNGNVCSGETIAVTCNDQSQEISVTEKSEIVAKNCTSNNESSTSPTTCESEDNESDKEMKNSTAEPQDNGGEGNSKSDDSSECMDESKAATGENQGTCDDNDDTDENVEPVDLPAEDDNPDEIEYEDSDSIKPSSEE